MIIPNASVTEEEYKFLLKGGAELEEYHIVLPEDSELIYFSGNGMVIELNNNIKINVYRSGKQNIVEVI